jgi:hypothetical protein
MLSEPKSTIETPAPICILFPWALDNPLVQRKALN